MSVSGLSIRRPVGVLMLGLCVLVLGGFFLARLPVDLLPSIVYPRIVVIVPYPGADPAIVEEQVTKVLERELATTDGVAKIRSTTREGIAFVNLFFNFGRNIDVALQDTVARLSVAQGNLPEDVDPARVFKFDPSQLPIIEFALSSATVTGSELRIYADEILSRQLGTVPGVAAALVLGGQKEEVRVLVDFPRLQSYGIGVTQVLEALRKENLDVAGGRVTTQLQEFQSRTSGKFASVDEIGGIPFLTRAGKKIYLRDFSEVVDLGAEQRVFAWFDGAEAIKLSILKQPDANTVSVADAIRERIRELRASGILPPAMELRPIYDQSWYVRTSIDNVSVAAGLGGLLATLIVFFFLGSLRRTFIIALSIPLAIFVTFIFMGLGGLTLNIFSLGGLALGVGMLVDGAVVMLENIHRHQLHKEEPLHAAQVAGKEVESPLVASTLTNIVALAPFLLLGGFTSLLFKELILTVIFAFAGALVVALTLVPMLSARLLALPRTSGLNRTRFFRAIERLQIAMTTRYVGAVGRVIRHPAPFLIVALLLFAASLPLATQLGAELLPQSDDHRGSIFIRLKPGVRLAENIETVRRVDSVVRRDPNVLATFAVAGGRIFSRSTSEDVTRGQIDFEARHTVPTSVVASQLMRKLQTLGIPDTRIFVRAAKIRGVATSFSTHNKDIGFMIQGPELPVLTQLVSLAMDAVRRVPGLLNVDTEADEPSPELQVVVDRERAIELGLRVEDVGNIVKTAVDGVVPTRLRRGDREVDLRVEFANTKIRSPSDLERLALFTPGGQRVPLYHLARVVAAIGPASITRNDQSRMIEIAGDIRGRSLGEVAADIRAALRTLDLPPGYHVVEGEEERSLRETNRNLFIIGLLAAFLVYVVMAVQYDSVINPLVIMGTVPLALTGSIVGLYVTKTPLGATVLLGVILLVGIVVNNAIIMIEYIEQLRKEHGYPRAQAVVTACGLRLRPILMTSITTVVGLVPLALGVGEGSEMTAPLGIVVLSGVSVSLLLTLFIIPCLYLTFEDLANLVRRLVGVAPRLAAAGPTFDPANVLNPIEELRISLRSAANGRPSPAVAALPVDGMGDGMGDAAASAAGKEVGGAAAEPPESAAAQSLAKPAQEAEHDHDGAPTSSSKLERGQWLI